MWHPITEGRKAYRENYSMCLTDTCICICIPRDVWREVVEKFALWISPEEGFVLPTFSFDDTRFGDKGLVDVFFIEETECFELYFDRRLPKKEDTDRTIILSTVISLYYLFTALSDESLLQEAQEGEYEQLFLIEGVYTKEDRLQGFCFSVHVPFTTRELIRKYAHDIDTEKLVSIIIKQMGRNEEQNKYGYFSIRESGTFYAHTIGNCACLSMSSHSSNDGYTLSGHNLDTEYQQLSLMCGVVAFWERLTECINKIQHA